MRLLLRIADLLLLDRITQQRGKAFRIRRRLWRELVAFPIDRVGFELLLAALQLAPAVAVSVKTMRDARCRISQAPRVAERDLEDVVYLACAVDGPAQLLVTEDSDLRSLGGAYQGVHMLTGTNSKLNLVKRGLIVN
jgi:hypothetical protein